MLTPPRHFAITACPPVPVPFSTLPPDTSTPPAKADDAPEILYRGAIPDTRNIAFLRRLRLKTILVLSPKEPKDVESFAPGSKGGPGSGPSGSNVGGGGMNGDVQNLMAGSSKARSRLTPLGRMKKKEGVDVRWIKVDRMGEEKLGMGKTEVGEVLKVRIVPHASLYARFARLVALHRLWNAERGRSRKADEIGDPRHLALPALCCRPGRQIAHIAHHCLSAQATRVAYGQYHPGA